MRNNDIIDEMLKLFGPNGEGWCKKRLYVYSSEDIIEKACLLGAIIESGNRLNMVYGLKLDEDFYNKILKMVNKKGYESIQWFNDDSKTEFSDIKKLLIDAKD